jgi:hypothetical protein
MSALCIEPANCAERAINNAARVTVLDLPTVLGRHLPSQTVAGEGWREKKGRAEGALGAPWRFIRIPRHRTPFVYLIATAEIQGKSAG